jgi:hypothetical protein
MVRFGHLFGASPLSDAFGVAAPLSAQKLTTVEVQHPEGPPRMEKVGLQRLAQRADYFTREPVGRAGLGAWAAEGKSLTAFDLPDC